MGKGMRAHPKIELAGRSIAVSSTISETAEDEQCWSKHVVCIHK
jgi:hypothetical protein